MRRTIQNQTNQEFNQKLTGISILQGLHIGSKNIDSNQDEDFCQGKTPKTEPKSLNQKNRTKKYHALDMYICFCFVCIIIYTIVHTYIFYKTGTEASVLDALFYGVFGGEVLLCALIKRLKLKQEHEQYMKSKQDDDIEEVQLAEDRYNEQC